MTTPAPPHPLTTALQTHLTAQSLPPSPTFLDQLARSLPAHTPLASAQHTARFRLLAADLRTALLATPASTLPPTICDPTTLERRLRGPLPVQVLDVRDVGRSAWAQVEALEAVERGERQRGREIVRVVEGGDDDDDDTGDRATTATAGRGEVGKGGPHKLTLQDASGATVFGVELAAVPGVSVEMSIGVKLRLANVRVARGVLLLEPGTVEVLGGKVEALHVAWRAGRKEALMERARTAGREMEGGGEERDDVVMTG